MASGSKRLRINALRHCDIAIMVIQWESKCIHWMPTTASCSTIFGMQDARTSVTPHTSIYIYGNGLIWTWIDENCMYPPWDARLALQISANAIFLLCMESCLLAQLHSSPMQSKAMEHSLPQRVRGRDCHCNESDIGIDIELEIIQDISTD